MLSEDGLHSWRKRGTASNRTKREVTKEEFDTFLTQHPNLYFDGMRYTQAIEMKGHTWYKPLAAETGGKFYLIND